MGDATGPIVEGDTSAVDDAPAALDDASPQLANQRSHSLGWWLSFAVPISIALVAILGAVVGYRVEYHASVSNAFDNDAQVSSTWLSGHDYNALITAQEAETDHTLWEQLAKAGGGHTAKDTATAAEPACADFEGGAVSELEAEATVNCQLAQLFSGYALPAYWEHGNPADFDTQRFVGDWIALGNLGRDVAVSHHTAAADDQRHKELRLLWLGILLALALAFCTMAQAAMHHRWSRRPDRVALVLAIPGWLVLVACSALLLAWEL